MKKLLDYLGLFFIPILIIMAVFLRLDITPFGENSIWYIDLPQQMTMFYNHLYDVLKGNSSAFYSWSYGMGTSFWATIAYYVSSPLSILILLFPKSMMPYTILAIWLVKIGLSSLTMSYLLTKHFTAKRFVIYMASISYALMSYSMTYYFLPMWIDAVYLLPMIIAGIYNLLKSENSHLFLVSLTIMFFANFYISYMVGIFVFLYFIGELYINRFGKKEIMKRIGLFFKSVFLAFLFTSFITIPTFLELRKNKYSAEDVNVLSFILHPMELYGSFFNGTTTMQYLSIYTGLGVILLVPLYFLNAKYPIRERTVYGLLLGFILYSMTFNLFNMVWHVFEMTNGAFYRYAFIVSFFMVILAVKAVNGLEFSMARKVVGVTAGNILFLLLANKLLNGDIFSIWLINKNILILFFLAGFVLILMNKSASRTLHNLAKIGLCLLILADLGMNTQTIFRNYIGGSFHGNNWYDVHNPSYSKALERLQKLDDSFYRTKIDPDLITSLNQSLRYKYKGMDIYTSTGNSEQNLFLTGLGYSGDARTVVMGDGIFLSDALLGFKYVVTLAELDESIYTKMFEEGKIKVYKVNLHLPLGYMVDKKFMDVKEGQVDLFRIQNRLINGKSEDYYEQPQQELKFNSLERVINSEGKEVLQRIHGDSAPSIETVIDVSNTRELYMKMEDEETQNNLPIKADILINDVKVNARNMRVGNLIDLGTYDDEKLKVSITLNDKTETFPVPAFYTLNYSNLEKEINELNNKTLVVKNYSDTHVTGEISVEQNNETLFLSVLYDENWQVTVDGKATEYKKIGSFIGIPLDKGTHTIHLEYKPKMIYRMMGISAVSLLAYISYQGLARRQRRFISREKSLEG